MRRGYGRVQPGLLTRAHFHLRGSVRLYDLWHEFPFHPHIHWTLLIAYLIGIASGIWLYASGMLYSHAAAADGATVTFPVSGAPVGSFVAPLKTLVIFTPLSALEPFSTITITFPEGTKLSTPEIDQNDFDISQAAPDLADGNCKDGKPSPANAAAVNGSARTIALTSNANSLTKGNCKPAKGLGALTIALSGKASGKEIQLPETATENATVSASSSKGDQATKSGVSFVADLASQLTFTEQPPAEATAQEAFSDNPVVEVRDKYNNPVTNFSGQATLAVVLSDDQNKSGTGSIAAQKIPVNFEKGKVTFSAVTYSAAETIVLKASSNNFEARSRAVRVKARAAAAAAPAPVTSPAAVQNTPAAATSGAASSGAGASASVSSASQTTTSTEQSFPATRQPAAASPQPTIPKVTIVVRDEQARPVVGAKVTLFSQPRTAITDANGVATFEDVEATEHRLRVEIAGVVSEQKITVGADNAKLQVKVARAGGEAQKIAAPRAAPQGQAMSDIGTQMSQLLLTIVAMGFAVAVVIIIVNTARP